MLNNDGKGILFVNDVDETTLDDKMVTHLVAVTKHCSEFTCGPKFLLTCRNWPLSSKYFHQSFSMSGFTLDQGIEYIERYSMPRHVPHSELVNCIKGQKEKLNMLLTNPLMTNIFCKLIASKEIELNDVETLNIMKLMKCFEVHMLRREGYEKTSSTYEEDFYELCLRTLLAGANHFRNTEVNEKSPYMIFLTKSHYIDEHGQDLTNLSFIHEEMFEFFAALGIIQNLFKNSKEEKDALLLQLCSNSKLIPLLQLTSAYICQYAVELIDQLVAIIRATLILQGKPKEKGAHKGSAKLSLLPVEVLDIWSNPDLIKHTARDVSKYWEMIHKAFDKEAEKLRDADWLVHQYSLDDR